MSTVFIKCNNDKKIKCKTINLEQEDNYYCLTAEVPLKYLNYFNGRTIPVSLNIKRLFFFSKELLRFDDSLLPVYHVKDNKLYLIFEVFI